MNRRFFLTLLLPLVAFSGCGKTREMEVPKGGGEVVEEKVNLAGKKILMVVAPKDFRDEEFLEPKKIFDEVGATVTVSSKGVTEASGMLGATAKIDKDSSEVAAADFDAIVFIGGSGAKVYFDDPLALNLAKSGFAAGKVVAAICIAPSILANAEVLQGRRATAFASEKDNLESNGATYTGEAVTVDGKIITARGPEAAMEFGRAIVELLKP